MTLRRKRAVAAVAAGAVLAVLPASAAQARPRHDQSSKPVVVVSGLNNPRQLTLADRGRLLIAEAGKGGDLAKIAGPEGDTFVGFTGSISAVRQPSRAHDQSPKRIVTGLLSGAAQDGTNATGSDGVTTKGHSIYIQETFAPPNLLPSTIDLSQNGKLLEARPDGSVTPVADISAFEAANDPDGYGVDSDPYAVLATKHFFYVADAAANDVLKVFPDGTIKVFHVFPNLTTGACASKNDDPPGVAGCNFVPTSLAADRHGNLYVGGLSALVPGEAQVVKLDRWGNVRKIWNHFTSVTGLAVGRDGALYVSQLFATQSDPKSQIPGVLTKLGRHGNRTNIDVPFPAGIAVDERGNVYVSAYSTAPETGIGAPNSSGQVWRLRF